MAIQNTILTSTAQNIFQNTIGTTAITTIHLCNFSGVTQVANIFVVPNGSAANIQTMIYANVSIAASNVFVISAEKFVLSTVGDAIMANCSNSGAVTATISSIIV